MIPASHLVPKGRLTLEVHAERIGDYTISACA